MGFVWCSHDHCLSTELTCFHCGSFVFPLWIYTPEIVNLTYVLALERGHIHYITRAGEIYFTTFLLKYIR